MRGDYPALLAYHPYPLLSLPPDIYDRFTSWIYRCTYLLLFITYLET